MPGDAPTFAITGAAGFVAPRHLEAIKAVGGELVAALDPHDSVGILDRYAPGCRYFRKESRFFRHLRRHPVDWLVICSPNAEHEWQAQLGMQHGANVLCEKPLCLNPEHLDELEDAEAETGRRVFTVLQLRLHPAVLALPESTIDQHKVRFRYVTPRGPWYGYSWKGDEEQSGGLLFNIGVHLFDLMIHLFGRPRGSTAFFNRGGFLTRDILGPGIEIMLTGGRASGSLDCPLARVEWELSTLGDKRERVLEINGEPVDLTGGFEDLHVEVYCQVLRGHGYGISDARPAIELCHELRSKMTLMGGPAA